MSMSMQSESEKEDRENGEQVGSKMIDLRAETRGGKFGP